jgi:excisionase family DNA binding protein
MENSIDLVDSNEAARLLNVTPGTLSVWRATRRYPLKYVKVGRKVRYRRQDLIHFLEAQTQSGIGAQSSARRGRRSRNSRAA